MTCNTAGQRLHLKMHFVLRHFGMASQTIVKLQYRLGMGLMTSRALELHRPPDWKGFAFKLHALMTVETYLSFGLEAGLLRDKKLMAGRAVEGRHSADVVARLIMATCTILGLRFSCVQRRKMTRETLKVGSHNVDLMAGRFGDLRPLDLFVEMAALANFPRKFGVRADLFGMRRRPLPHNPRPILNPLPMADMAIHALMGALVPCFPCRLHNMA